jgi:iron-sulfur cluster insertion protein
MIETQPQTTQPLPAPPEPAVPLVRLTDAAAAKLRELTKEESDPTVGLRVYVYSGGCSGYRYGMMLEDQPTAEDVRVESQGINVYVDPQSTQLLSG